MMVFPLLFPIQKPSNIVKIDTISIPEEPRKENRYYWQRVMEGSLGQYNCSFAVWDLSNPELDGMEFQGRVDDFGNEFLLYSDAWNARNYFLVQRADDPGMFHYRMDSEKQNA